MKYVKRNRDGNVTGVFRWPNGLREILPNDHPDILAYLSRLELKSAVSSRWRMAVEKLLERKAVEPDASEEEKDYQRDKIPPASR